MHKLNNNKTTTGIWLYSRLAFREAICDIFDKNCESQYYNTGTNQMRQLTGMKYLRLKLIKQIQSKELKVTEIFKI